jgi:hypothetical protein
MGSAHAIQSRYSSHFLLQTCEAYPNRKPVHGISEPTLKGRRSPLCHMHRARARHPKGRDPITVKKKKKNYINPAQRA